MVVTRERFGHVDLRSWRCGAGEAVPRAAAI